MPNNPILRNLLAACALALTSSAADAASAIVATLPLPGHHAALAIDPVLRKGFVANTTTNQIEVIDVDAMAVVGRIPVAAGVARVLIDAARHRVYVLHANAPGAITTIDGRSHAVLARTAIGDSPNSMSADFRRSEIYTTDAGSQQLTVFDTKTSSVAATVFLGARPGAASVSTAYRKIYVPLTEAGTVAVIDQRSRAIARTLPLGMHPLGATVEEKDGGVYVVGTASSTDADQVVVIDSASDTIRETLGGLNATVDRASGNWLAPLFSPVYARAYFAAPLQGEVRMVDTAASSLGKTLALGGRPVIAAINADDGEIYVVDLDGETVTIIDALMERVAARLSIGARPYAVGRAGNGLLIIAGDGAGNDRAVFATTHGIQPDTAIATSYRHDRFDHYFHTANPTEARVLDDGAFGVDWLRTQEYWRVWKGPGSYGRQPVCRFFGTGFGDKSSHFYTPYFTECETVKGTPGWQYEETGYYVALPDKYGACALGLEPLYRVYNGGLGGAPNHLYTPNSLTRDALKYQGWIPEGTGPHAVFACTPPLAGFVTSPP